jgi:hypothetical protein
MFAGANKEGLSDYKTLNIANASLIKRVQGTERSQFMR